MSQFLDELSKEDRKRLRDEMQAQAELMLKPLYVTAMQLKAAARKFVDSALAQENRRSDMDLREFECPECGSEFESYDITSDMLTCSNNHQVTSAMAVRKNDADSSSTQEDSGQ